MNEVQGVVIDQEGKVVHRLFGKWHEGLYCGVAPSAKCIWRPGERPELLGQEAAGSRREGTEGHTMQFAVHFLLIVRSKM